MALQRSWGKWSGRRCLALLSHPSWFCLGVLCQQRARKPPFMPQSHPSAIPTVSGASCRRETIAPRIHPVMLTTSWKGGLNTDFVNEERADGAS